MRKLTCIALLNLSFVALFQTGCGRESDGGARSSLVVINSQTDMDAAIASRRAIILAHVQWSASSTLAKNTFLEFQNQLHKDPYAPKVDFYFVDLTDAQVQPSPHIANWLESDERLAGLPFRGSGDVVWLKDGVLQKWLPACDASVDDLARETASVFKN